MVSTVGAVGEGGEIEAARHGGAVDDDRAAAAQALAAALARAEEVEALLQHLDEGLVRADLGRDLAAVEGEADGARALGHLRPLRASRRARATPPRR